MQLQNLLHRVDIIAITGTLNRQITGITTDSRKVTPGNLFICYPGITVDGHQYIHAAVENGATAVIGEKKPPSELDKAAVTYLQTPNGRYANALLAANWHGNPAERLKLIGITGTNGKTSTAHLIHAILTANHRKAALLGTVGHQYETAFLPAALTTPDAFALHALFKQFVDAGIVYVVMETSSQGLAQQRLAGLTFDTAVFTNLTQDHLDYHGTMEEYLKAKLMLFAQLTDEGAAILNNDAPVSAHIASVVGTRQILKYGRQRHEDTEIGVKAVKLSRNRLTFTAVTPDGEFPAQIRLLGEYNLYNAMAAIGVALRYECPIHAIQEGLSTTVVPGRFELVDSGQQFAVIVDYAHTPNGLENVLTAARGMTENRLISVFGCGGDRDAGKRPQMGEISARLSDYTVVTSDNPRTEDPDGIIAQIVLNLPHDTDYVSISQRREAIQHAISIAQPGDVVVIAGKGHEDYQEIHGKRYPFDDRQVAAEALTQNQKTAG